MSSPASSWSLITVATASRCCSRKSTSPSAVEYGRSRRFPVYQVGRGHEPVTVVGSIRSFVAVSIAPDSFPAGNPLNVQYNDTERNRLSSSDHLSLSRRVTYSRIYRAQHENAT